MQREFRCHGKRIILTEHAQMRCRERKVNVGIAVQNLAAVLDGGRNGRICRRWIGDLGVVYERTQDGAKLITAFYRYEREERRARRRGVDERSDAPRV